MWMNNFVSRAHLQIFLPQAVEVKSAQRKGIAQRVRIEVAALVAQLQPTGASLLSQPGLSVYPWCFVMPAYAVSTGAYLAGAFIPADEASPSAAVCVLFSARKMEQQLKSETNLPFWMMRSLAALDRYNNCEEIESDCHDLMALNFPPVWRPKKWGSAQRLKIQARLSDIRCDADLALEGKSGVDVMPWRNWPGCVLESEFLWLWRQNRHGKIIESQRKLITGPVT